MDTEDRCEKTLTPCLGRTSFDSSLRRHPFKQLIMKNIQTGNEIEIVTIGKGLKSVTSYAEIIEADRDKVMRHSFIPK